MANKVKYQSKVVTIAAATAAGTVQEDTIELDNGYNEVTGVAVHLISDGTIANGYFTVGLADQNRIYHDRTHIDNWDGKDGVGPDHKFKKINMPVVQGMLFSIKTGVPAIPAAELSYEIVFRLEKQVTI